MTSHLGLADSVLTNVAITPRNAAGSAINSAAIDTQGWMAIAFDVSVGVLGTNGTADFAVYESNDSAMANAVLVRDADTNGNAVVTQMTNANSVALIEVWRPLRYVRAVATGHTNGAFVNANYHLYRRQGTLPPTQAAGQYVKIRAR